MTWQQAGTTGIAIRAGAVGFAEAVDAFLASPWVGSPNTRRVYVGVLGRLAAGHRLRLQVRPRAASC